MDVPIVLNEAPKKINTEKFGMITKIIPFIAPTIIVLSTVKEILFYKAFNINITDFLDLSEVIMLFFDDLPGLIICFFALYFPVYYSILSVKRIAVSSPKQGNPKRKGEIRKSYVYLTLSAVSFFIGFVNLFDPFFYLLIPGFIVLYSLPLFFSFLMKPIKETFEVSIAKYYLSAICLIAVCIYFEGLVLSEIYDVKHKHCYTGTFIETDANCYLSSDSYFYIGRTRNFIFLYERTSCTTTVIPESKIKKIRISRTHTLYDFQYFLYHFRRYLSVLRIFKY